MLEFNNWKSLKVLENDSFFTCESFIESCLSRVLLVSALKVLEFLDLKSLKVVGLNN